MSAEIVQAQYEALEQVASTFGQWTDATGELERRVNAAFEQLEQGGWEGRGSAAFFGEMNGEIFPALQRLAQALQLARSVSLEIKELMQQAEEEASAPFRGWSLEGLAAVGSAGGGGGILDSIGSAIGSAVSGVGSAIGSAVSGVGDVLGSIAGGVGDFFGGVYDEGKDMVLGLVNMVAHPVDTAKGLWHAVTHPGEFWDAFKQPYVEAWESGHPWRAIGRGTMFIGSLLIGTKGADKVAKASKLSTAARVTADAAEVGTRLGAPLDAAKAMGTVSKGSRAETAMARYIADQSTHNPAGPRVVLGGGRPNPATGFEGYIKEAQKTGGRYYSTTDEVWDAVKPGTGNGRGWAANREFLQSQLEKGVPRIDLTGETVSEVLGSTVRRNSYTAMEIRFLQRRAYEYGYKQVGSSWVKTGDWRASTGGRIAGGSVGPGLDVIEDAQSLGGNR